MKKILLLFLAVFLVSLVSAYITPVPMDSWNLDAGATYPDPSSYFETHNMTAYNNPTIYPISTEPLLYNGSTHDGSTEYFVVSNPTTFNFTNGDDYTLEVWLRPHDVSNYQTISDYGSDAGFIVNWIVQIINTGKVRFCTSSGCGGGNYIDSSSTLTANNLYHLVFTHNSAGATGNSTIYINGNPDFSGSANSPDGAGGTINLGRRGDSAQYYDGDLLYFAIYDSALTSDNVTTLYTEAEQYSGLLLNVTAISPAINDHTNNQPLIYQVNLTDSTNANCTLHFNDTNTSTLTSQTAGLVNFSTTRPEGSYTWYVNCTDEFSSAITTTRNITLDYSAPDWTINSIATDNTSSFLSTQDYIFNDSVDDFYLFAWNISITNASGNVMYSNQTTGLTTTLETINDVVDMATWNAGYYDVNFYAEDDHTAKWIPPIDYVIQPDTITYYTPTADVTLTSTRMEGDVIETTKLADRYTFTFGESSEKSIWTFRLESTEKLYYREDLYTFPSFVTGKQWIDFNTGMSNTIYEVIKEDDYTYEIEIETENEAESITFYSLGGLNSVNETYEFGLDVIPPDNAANLTNTSTGKTWIYLDWDDPEDILWNHTQVYNNLSFVANVTTNEYNLTGLQPNTTYTIKLYTVSHEGYKNTTGISESFTTTTNEDPTITDYTPATNPTINEMESETFNVTATDPDGIASYNWTLDGTTQATTQSWTYTPGKNDQGTYTISVTVTDNLGGTSTVQWTATVSDTYFIPNEISILTPRNGYYDEYAIVYCGNEQEASSDDPFYYYVEYQYNGTGSWYELYNNTLGYGVIDLRTEPYGTTIDFRCQISNDAGNNSLYNPTGNITRNRQVNFEVNTLTTEWHTQYKPFDMMFFGDLENTSDKISMAGFDCNGDDIMDYRFEYDNKTRISEFVTCVLPRGVHLLSAYFVLEKNNTYDYAACNEIKSDEKCVVQTHRKLRVY